MNKIENNLIFEAYAKKSSTVTEKKDQKGKKIEEKKACGCKGKCKCGTGKKKKVMKEHHEKYPPEVLDMTVGDLLSKLEEANQELYHLVEQYLDSNAERLAAARADLSSPTATEAPPSL